MFGPFQETTMICGSRQYDTGRPVPEALTDSQLDRELLTLRLDVHEDKIRALALLEEYQRRQLVFETN